MEGTLIGFNLEKLSPRRSFLALVEMTNLPHPIGVSSSIVLPSKAQWLSDLPRRDEELATKKRARMSRDPSNTADDGEDTKQNNPLTDNSQVENGEREKLLISYHITL